MTELLIRLMNASPRSQRLLAVGLLFATGLIAIGVLQAAIQLVWYQQDQLAQQRKDLARISGLLAQRPSIETFVQAPANQGVFLEGGDGGVLQAKLQEIVAAISTRTGSIVSSATGIPETAIDGIPYIGLRVDFEGGLKSTLDTVVAIETFQPQLIVQRAQMRATNVSAGEKLTEAVQLSTQLTIFAPTRPTASTPPDGVSP